MKQIIYDKSGRVLVKTVPVPEIESGEILVRNDFSVVSAGTEKSMVQLMKKPLWKMALERPDLSRQVIKFAKDSGIKKTIDLVKSRIDVWHLLGYSSAGTVVHSEAREFSVGDRVACIGSGFANHAEYIAVPRTLAAKIPKDLDSKQAAFTGIACIALQSIRQLNPQLGETIVVMGLGMIGQMVAQMLRANGCRVIGVDIDKSKTQQDFIDEGISEDAIRSVHKITKSGADGVIIAAASKENIVNDAFDMCRKRGRVVLLGMSGMLIDRQRMFEKELDFKVSTAFGAGSFDTSYESGIDYPKEYVRWTSQRNMEAVLDLMQSKKLVMDAEIYPIEQAKEAYKKMSGKPILFQYNPDDFSQTIEVKKDFKKGKINIAIIGAGQFAKAFLLPTLKKRFTIYAVATKSGANAKKLSDELGAKYASTSYTDLLKDKNIDLVVIATRHDSHARIATDALKAGKHVFCEKPVAINEKEFVGLKKAIKESNRLFTCGFNRRYAPVFKKLKNDLTNDPMTINYFFNNPALPDDHWVNDPEIGGGRIIGEACHIIDLMSYLTNSSPIALQAFNISTDTNSMVASIKYKDGSIANITYNCQGNNSVERETCTLTQNRTVYVLNGFGSLRKNNSKVYSGSADEGHENEILELQKAMQGKENDLVTAEVCIKTTETVFAIIKSAK